MHSEENAVEEYNSQIEWLEETKPQGYEDSIKLYEFMRDNKISYDDWRYSAAYSLDGMTYQEMSPYLDVLAGDNWKDYCQLKLDNEELSAGEKMGVCIPYRKGYSFFRGILKAEFDNNRGKSGKGCLAVHKLGR